MKTNFDKTTQTLTKQDKKPVMLPLSQTEKEPLLVAINGSIYSIPRGQMVEVPLSVYEVVQEHINKTLAAHNKIKITQKEI